MGTRAEKQAEKRASILNAALELFAERGFHGTAMPELADRAGVGAGTIYRYFESKERLVNELYRKWKSAFGAALTDDFPFDAPVREQFHLFCTRLASFARNNLTAMSFLELHHHQDYLDEESKALELQLHTMGTSVIQLGQSQQILKEGDPDMLLSLVLGGFVGVLKAQRQGLLHIDDEMVAQIERCLWETIRR